MFSLFRLSEFEIESAKLKNKILSKIDALIKKDAKIEKYEDPQIITLKIGLLTASSPSLYDLTTVISINKNYIESLTPEHKKVIFNYIHELYNQATNSKVEKYLEV